MKIAEPRTLMSIDELRQRKPNIFCTARILHGGLPMLTSTALTASTEQTVILAFLATRAEVCCSRPTRWRISSLRQSPSQRITGHMELKVHSRLSWKCPD